MIEDTVLTELPSFLHDRLRLTKALPLTGPCMEDLLSEAFRLGDRILKDGPTEQRVFFLEVVRRIVVQQDRVSVMLRPLVLHAMLSHGRPDDVNAKTAVRDEEELRLEIPVRFKRRGVEMKLVVTDDRKRPPETRRRNGADLGKEQSPESKTYAEIAPDARKLEPLRRAVLWLPVRPEAFGGGARPKRTRLCQLSLLNRENTGYFRKFNSNR